MFAALKKGAAAAYVEPEENKLVALRKAAENLESVPELNALILKRAMNAVEYEGDCIGTRLFSIEHFAAAQQAFMRAGATFPTHQHDEWEHLIVVSGEILVRFGEDDEEGISAGPGENVYISPMTPHTCEAVQDTWMIGITVPPSGSYP